jgi:hypothetical protein
VLDTLSTSVKSLMEASEVHYKNMGIYQIVHSHAELLKQHTETYATLFRGDGASDAGDAESKAECTKMLLSELQRSLRNSSFAQVQPSNPSLCFLPSSSPLIATEAIDLSRSLHKPAADV